TIAGNGAIPVMLIVLGMQIADLRPDEGARYIWPAAGLRLLAGPVVGVLVATLIGLQGIGRSAMIIEATTPTAAINLILAADCDSSTGGVARRVVLSSLISPITIAATITILGL